MNYKTGGKKIVMPEQAKIVDPKSEKSFRGQNKIAKVKGSRAARKQKDVTWV